MNIGTVASRSGVSAKTIRYYESIHLLPEPARSENGYRMYQQRDAEILRFVQQARRLGFSIKDVKSLLSLWRNRDRSSAEVKTLANRHVLETEARIRELQAIRDSLVHLIHTCRGDERPECPILEGLADGEISHHKEKTE